MIAFALITLSLRVTGRESLYTFYFIKALVCETKCFKHTVHVEQFSSRRLWAFWWYHGTPLEFTLERLTYVLPFKITSGSNVNFEP